MFKNKKYLIIASLIVVFIAAAAFFVVQIKPESGKTFKVKKGNLETVINCKGEVKGEKYTEINLPDEICDRELRVYQLKIVDVVLEGKEVKKGDYIAKIDESLLATQMRNQMQEMEKMVSDLRNAMLDSTVTLSKKRESITNAKLDLEYLKIDLEQSKYESEAYQRKTQMNYQKAELEVEKIRRDYLLDKNRLKIQVGRYQSRVADYQSRIDKYQKAIAATTIRTPEDGIVMFAKDWSGKTYGKDSEVNIWNPLIATLPDMSVVITEAYIKEIDISKVQLNDSVRITIDALSGRVFTGKVIKIATIGEDHKDFDMKAFKVIIRYEKTDKDLKPGMTANNDIIVGNFKDKLLVARQAIFSKNGKQIVYLKKGGNITEQEIELIAENDLFGAVENNLNEGDVLLLYQPDEFKVETEKIASRQ
ncbi:MAG: efflux RND transporter periplasmic adaptor subunit [Prolixibacteraceae bacterium]|nr:efflux RND transporter periplasmic adaptor subunit [Prolixibacteraceae bacterium]